LELLFRSHQVDPGHRDKTPLVELDMTNAAAAALFAALLSGIAPALCAADSPDTSNQDNEGSAKELAASIERFNALDPQSPDTLNARLAYAVFLTRKDAGDCRVRLEGAQSQLNLVKGNPALDTTLPAGLARATDVDYRIHSARAACGAAELREAELRAALGSAQLAVELYRNAYDAVSMVTMQFNSSVAYHDLGDSAAAILALQEAINMDREYGYAEDAEDNYALLLQWKSEAASPDQVAARMQDFPERSATLAFGWFPSVSEVKVESDYTQIADGEVSTVHGTRSAQRRVRKGLTSWGVSFQAAPAHFDLAIPPTQEPALQGLATSLAGMLLQFHDFELARNGDFGDAKGGYKFGSRVRADVSELTRDLDSRGTPTAQLMRSVSKALSAQQSPDVTDSLVAENYNFETGTWIGATLEQGVWYNMMASLSLPLEPQVFVWHEIEFAYTHPVPCLADAKEAACIEIVLHATPDPAVLEEMLRALARGARLPRAQLPKLQAITDMRLVVDPVTLVAYRRDVRRYSYWSDGTTGPNHALTEFEKTSIVSSSLPPADDSRR
jgi:tetratricopeptide (TPR) repeat protein